MEQLASILDLRTIFLVSMIVYFICALLVFQLWRQNRPRFRGIGYLALNYAIQVAGLLLLVTRGIIPDFISVVIANGLMAAGIAIGYYGFTLFCGKPQRMGLWIALILIFMLAQAYWFYLEPSLMWRKVNSSMIMLVAGVLTAFYLLRVVQEPIRSFTGQIGWVHLIYAAFFAVRIAVTISERQSSEGFFDHKTWDAVLSLFYPALFVLMTSAVSLMINRRLAWETEQAKAELKVLSGLLPICAHCKKVRDDSGYWNQIESYISKHSEADFSHGICPECVETHFPEFNRKKKD